MRYSAVTTDPDYFDHDAGWTLRAEQYGRSTELLIAIVRPTFRGKLARR